MPASGELALIASHQLRLEKADDNLTRMLEAFEHLESGVVLYGPDDCIVFCNRRFREMYREVDDLLVPGSRYADIERVFYQRGFQHRTKLDEENYVRTRVDKHMHPDEGDYEWLLRDDLWLLASDRKTVDGGVIVCTRHCHRPGRRREPARHHRLGEKFRHARGACRRGARRAT